MKTNTYKEQFLQIFNSIDFDSIIDHPNILIAASFWDYDRYCAAKTCYKFMRKIDDLIDNHKASNEKIAPDERKAFLTDVSKWLEMIVISDDCNPDKEALNKTVERFRIPLWTLESFARSMIYDINNDGFKTLEDFIEYSQGASVAPASIFVHLSGLKQAGDGYREPEFDVREAATPCALFSYLVHIIRDFQKDQLNHLNYFADNLVGKNGLSRQDLNDIAHGSQVTGGFRNLIREYHGIADKYRKKTIEIMKRIGPMMEPAYKLSLEIIFSLYLMVFERIDPVNGSFTSAELNPSPAETKDRVFETIMNFSIE
ncbi:MAG: squalene/phytoene synthase family protein [Bacteroidales bacterium]|nr:squalene/phytoene synthase family protein [Bacteroidales bacterium]